MHDTMLEQEPIVESIHEESEQKNFFVDPTPTPVVVLFLWSLLVSVLSVAIKADFGRSKADGLKGVTHQRRNFYVCLGANLAHHVDLAGGYQRLNGHAGCRILFQQGIKDGVRNGVTNLIGMAF